MLRVVRFAGAADHAASKIEVFLGELLKDLETATLGSVLYQGRNRLLRVPFDGHDWVVKCFAVPNPAQRLGQVFRGSKAQRSFAHALELQRRGFATPRPLLYADLAGGRFAGLYVCAYHAGVVQARDLRSPTTPDRLERAFSLGGYCARLHLAGVVHRDLTPGNILFDPSQPPSDANWLLVDLNRMHFLKGALDPRSSVAALAGLCFEGEVQESVLEGWCAAQNLSIAQWRPILEKITWWHRMRLRIQNGTRKFRHPLRKS
jgi:serine/threonine protein kinase